MLRRNNLSFLIIGLTLWVFVVSPSSHAFHLVVPPRRYCDVVGTKTWTTTTSSSSSAPSSVCVIRSSTFATRFFAEKADSNPSSGDESASKSKLPFFLDPGTKGGAVFLSLVLFVIPLIFYNVVVATTDFDELEVGKWIGVGFTVLATLAWVSTYIFRVATKDMTYAKQLKDYEDAVIAKRLEELDESELQALVEEVERDEF